jgi:hypothetical protein
LGYLQIIERIDKSLANPARSHDELDNNPLAIDNILKPLELIPCGLGISTPHHIPPGHKVDCLELNSRILRGEITEYNADQAQPTMTHSMPSLRAFTTSTTMPQPSDTADFVDPSSYPPTEPSSFYEVDPTLRPDILNPLQMPVMSVVKPTVPGGPTITAIVEHLSVVLDVPPTLSPSTTTPLPLTSPTSVGDQEN